MIRGVGTGGEDADVQLSPLLSACNCLKMPKFVVVLGALGGCRVQREELPLPTNHPCLPQDDAAVVS